jgi:hypothetical protein
MMIVWRWAQVPIAIFIYFFEIPYSILYKKMYISRCVNSIKLNQLQPMANHHRHGKKVVKQQPLSATEQLARLFILLLGVGIGAALVYLLIERFF